MVLSCTGGYNGASLSAGGDNTSALRAHLWQILSFVYHVIFLKTIKKCVSPNISGLTHFCYTICLWNFLPFFIFHPPLHRKRVAALQLDLRRNATRCTPIIAEANRNFKWFFHIRCRFLFHIISRRLLRCDAAQQCFLDHVHLLRPSHQPIVFAP